MLIGSAILRETDHVTGLLLAPRYKIRTNREKLAAPLRYFAWLVVLWPEETRYLRRLGVSIMSIHYRPSFPAVKIGSISPLQLRYQHRNGMYRDTAKRVFDLLVTAILAVPTLLIMLIVMPFIAADGTSPIYRQERIGRNGRKFRIWKLRSMVPNADEKLAAYLVANPQARIEWDHHQKLIHDPRITRIGRFIRKTSIDELPQLLNVLFGEMSLVGPRPMMTSQQDIYPGQAYYEMRPGITGAWQVSDRHETSFAERALFDTRYYNQVSLGTDIGIILRTVGVVARASGC